MLFNLRSANNRQVLETYSDTYSILKYISGKFYKYGLSNDYQCFPCAINGMMIRVFNPLIINDCKIFCVAIKLLDYTFLASFKFHFRSVRQCITILRQSVSRIFTKSCSSMFLMTGCPGTRLLTSKDGVRDLIT